MGEIVVAAKLENAGDRVAFEQAYHDESRIRRTQVVDTGAVTLVLPQNVVERLGSPLSEPLIGQVVGQH